MRGMCTLFPVALLATFVLAHCAGPPPRVTPPSAPKVSRTLSQIVTELTKKVGSGATGRVGIVPFVERRSGERTLAGDYVADFFYPELKEIAEVLVDRGFALRAAYDELCRSHSLRVDAQTAIDIGRQVSAQSVLTGMLTDLKGEGQRLDVRLLDVASGRVLGSAGRFLPAGSIPSDLIGKTPPDFALECGQSSPSEEAVDLNVAVRKWGGYAGGLYYNGGLEPSAESRFLRQGLRVHFKVFDSIAASVKAWRSGEVDVMWITVDALPTEYHQLKNEQPKIFLQTGWSRGEEVVVARDSITTLNDLKDKKIALEKNTTAHSFLLVSLDLAGLDYGDVTVVPARNNRDAANKFIRGDVDAAVMWIDEDEHSLEVVRDAHRLESTQDASYLIAESLVVRSSTLREKREAIGRLAEGWLRANAELNRDPRARRKATELMVEAFRVSRHVAEAEMDMVRLATLGDNQNFFGLNPAYRGEKGQALYRYFIKRYQTIKVARGRMPAWSQLSDTSVLAGLQSRLQGPEHEAESPPDFGHCRDNDELPLSKKSLAVTFKTGESQLTPDDRHIIDEEFAHLAEIYYNDCIRIDGNTDNRGALDYNIQLSKKRAASVAQYLRKRYGFSPLRIISVGNGPNNPVDTNDTEIGRAKNRRTDFELLHKRH
ncbi:MAG: OmpA family protein [Myxococcales bacterium]|nr:OmpA family protein [Myxococcales bacterium]